MKKYSLIIVAIVMAVMSCKPQMTSQEKIDAFNAQFELADSLFSAEVERIQADTTISKDSAAVILDSLYDKTVAEISEFSLKTIKDNGADSVALVALQKANSLFEDDVLNEALAAFKGDLAEAELVVKLKARMAAKAATAEGQKFTDFTVIEDPADSTTAVKFSDFVGKGKYVLVDFWASWCGPCKREIPNIAAVYEKYAGDDFDVLSVAVWDKIDDTKAAAVEHGVVWNQIINAQKIPTDLYGIEGIPHIMLVGPDGTILKRNLRGEAIEKAVAEALGR